MQDEETGLELAVVTDRAQGMASLEPGSLEAMLHFRCVPPLSGCGQA